MGGVRDAVKLVINCGLGALFVYTLFISYELAYDIRMYTIITYGKSRQRPRGGRSRIQNRTAVIRPTTGVYCASKIGRTV